MGHSQRNNHLKTEILAITAATAPRAAEEGWRLRKSGTRFSRDLCPGVTLHVEPRFIFQHQGLICLTAPVAPVESRAVGRVLKQVFGTSGIGPVCHDFNVINADPDRRSPGLKARFDASSVHFIDMEVPGYDDSNGHYQTETLPDYLAELRKTALTVMQEDYDLSSEAAFLRSLPTRRTPGDAYYGNPHTAHVSFAVTRILCGETDAVARLRADHPDWIGGQAAKLLDRLEAAAPEVAPLADGA
ncbi:hypothetical protein GCM10011360_41810 [Primorskyibacter flagellatus]|uniref:Uncharacterized protein n=1 Tax=Primorskyibacter flagellatus TaxID=1387277 RepID=A0A917AGS8_9RHOB|nr:hypothetical protein [Primorskyibacter flagellatus]GGE50376.1 hypothetical protein GCM10011360_41810 [Primorskyibacter flagellatus]